MKASRLLDVLNDLGEQDTLEAKSIHEDTSRSVLETVCSFSNEHHPAQAYVAKCKV